jgi:alkylhydroperoxidase family enzyme
MGLRYAPRVSDAVTERYAPLVRELIGAAMSAPGDTDAATRGAAFDIGRRAAGGSAPEDAAIVDPAVRAFLRKAATHAYRVTDRDVADLRDAGWSEDALLELIVSTAIGSGVARLERGIAAVETAMEGGSP